MTSSKIQAAVIQTSFSDYRENNWSNLGTLLEQAAKNGAELVVLPELHNGHYFCQHEDQREFSRAETIPGPTCEFLSGIARKHNMVIIGSVFERRTAGLYHNTAIALDTDGTLAGYYRKMHIPDDPGFYEKYYFTPGDTGFRPIETQLGKIGVLICWDQWFPEAARLMALAGADLLVYPTAIGWDPADDQAEQQRQLDSWLTVQRGHAISNGLPLLAANRLGHEADPAGTSQGINFWGNSFVCGPQGEIMAQASATEGHVLTAEINFSVSEKVRQTWPFLRDRRIDAYTGITSRFPDSYTSGAKITDNIEPDTGEKND